jgi:hypothetical protein
MHLMLSVSIWLIVLGTSMWVLHDSKTIGVKKGQIKGPTDMGPWGWFLVCLGLWIVGFPVYLAKRSEYIRINSLPAAALPEDEEFDPPDFPIIKARPEEGRGATFLQAVAGVAMICGALWLIGRPIYEAHRKAAGVTNTAGDKIAANLNDRNDSEEDGRASGDGQASEENNGPSEASGEAGPADTGGFNTGDRKIESNGNLAVAVQRIAGESPQSTWETAPDRSVASITLKPYDALGKLCKIKGRIYRMEQASPDLKLGEDWMEIQLLCNNPKSPLGATSVDFLYKGDATSFRSGGILTLAGYFIGTFERANAMGGRVEVLSIVGNAATAKS